TVDEEIAAFEFDDRWYTLKNGGLVGLLKRCMTFTSSEGIRNWAETYMESVACPDCHGARLKKESLFFKIDDKNISELAEWDLNVLADWFQNLDERLNERQQQI